MPNLSDHLHPDLAARALGADRPARSGGELIVLWIRGAMRAQSNPALEAAIELSTALDVPLLCYQALDDRHPYASDRMWRFVLDGARELARGLEARGVRYAFHLVRPGHRVPALRDLAARSAAVVCDVHPVEPVRGWTDALAAQVDAPIVEVDASCVVPLTETRKPYERAFAFKNATKKARKRWLGWEPEERAAPARYGGALPFEPLDLEGDLDAAIAECEVEHGIGPIAHTRGGSSEGYARWDAFVERGLARYARTRNDALRDGVSRMSAYLHFGMVSALRIAAEAERFGGAGAEKYLDELLVWREVAWHFCHHRRDIDTVASLPEWAQETLAEHADDERPRLLSWDALAHAASGDALWDAAQTSLLRQGELHNNLRMTWGKALLEWTRGPEECLARLLDLNHRYALDGRDPSSYGGILWCLGQFDKPFPPEGAIRGTVRERTTRVHASRLDVGRYAARVERPASGEALRVAVVGAGLVGVAAARALDDAGHDVCVFTDGIAAPDAGTIEFDAWDPRFLRFVEAWETEGLASRGGVDGRWTADAAALVERCARGLTVRSEAALESIHASGAASTLHFAGGRTGGSFDAVLVALPPERASALLDEDAPTYD
ncbi:MAG: deoxyribodipyrimidine photo-lyase, partial [Planctomycetota bacterium]